MPHRNAVVALLVLILLVPAAAGAVSIEKGLKAGVNRAGFRGGFADRADTQNKLGFVGGPFVAFGLAPDLAVQVEALFSMKGAKTTGERTDEEGHVLGEFTGFWNLNYLEVPILLRGTLLRTAAVQPMWYIGPTLGLSYGGTFTVDVGAAERDLIDLKTVDFGVAIGGGAGFKAGGRRILVELRYTSGFTDIYDIEDNAESINDVFSLTVGIAF